MEWKNHKICNLALVYGLTGDVRVTLLSTVGAILPDVLECNGWLFRHRTVTHYPWIYLAFLACAGTYTHTSWGLYIAFWLVVGCTLHLVLDALSKTGIPYRTPGGNKCLAFNLYTTHHISEFKVAAVIVALAAATAYFRHFFTMAHFTRSISLIFSR